LKKVLDIVPYPFLPWFSGGQKSIGQFLEFLGSETDLTVAGTVTNDWTHARNYSGIPLLKKGSSRYWDLSLIRSITSLIKKNNYDAVIWEHPYYWWLAKRIRKRTGAKTIFHTHNIEYLRFKSNGKWWWPVLRNYERSCFRGADIVFFISDDDREFAISKWKIDPAKCFTIPFGVPIKEFPADKQECKRKLAAIHGIGEDEKIFLFNGLLGYKPNLDAVLAILKNINPILREKADFKYKIILCGKGLPEEYNGLKDYSDKNIIHAGFVDDIEMYFKGSDLFLNPVLSGGGIKTKMVESIAFGTTVISTANGAIGIDKKFCGEKLIVIPDNDWDGFAEAVIRNVQANSITPSEYYEHYYWGSIVKRAVEAVDQCISVR
jgi:glycosyltransferase involved in cell wall biosynthesis